MESSTSTPSFISIKIPEFDIYFSYNTFASSFNILTSSFTISAVISAILIFS